MAQQLGGKVEGGHHREFGRADVEILEAERRCSTASGSRREISGVDEPRRPRHQLPAGFEVIAKAPGTRPSPIIADEARRFYACSSTRKWCTRRTAPSCSQLRAQDRRPQGRLDDGRLRDERSRRSARRSARAGDLRPVGRRRFLGRGRADPRGDRRPADLRLRRSRPDAARTRPKRSSPVPRPLQHPAGPCRCEREAVPRRAGRRHRPRETKRKTIGRLFIDVFEAEAKKIGGAEFLAQGTLYPDVIESVSFTGGPVGHDQVAPQCRRPARAHEHEAGRAAARTVQGRGARAGPRTRPAGRVRRPPSVPRPGPRDPLPGEITREKLDILRKADAIYLDEIRKAGLYDEIWQAFAVLLPVKTVGVMGDGRTYDHVLRAARRDLGRRHDGGFLPLRHELPRPHRHPHHQRGEGRQPRGLRRDSASRRARSSGNEGSRGFKDRAGRRSWPGRWTVRVMGAGPNCRNGLCRAPRVAAVPGGTCGEKPGRPERPGPVYLM
jgi:GMP synthase (glutamine-hydrolysing)